MPVLVRFFRDQGECCEPLAAVLSSHRRLQYTLSDAAVILGLPVVSGAALRTDGQLTVYAARRGVPCYRCLHPVCPPPAVVRDSCSAEGVFGPVPGVIGTLMAGEALQLILRGDSPHCGHMATYDALTGRWRRIKLRGASAECAACGSEPSITADAMPDYYAFTSTQPGDGAVHLLQRADRVTPAEYAALDGEHALIDVRPRGQYDLFSLEGSISLPLAELRTPEGLDRVRDASSNFSVPLVFVCRRGNASQKAVVAMRESGLLPADAPKPIDIVGGTNNFPGAPQL